MLTEKNRKWWILVAMTSCIAMIFIDVTVLPVALPTIQRDLNFNQLVLQWIVNAYTLALSIFVLAGGRMGDRISHKKIFCYGLLFFALGSILCGISYHPWEFIAARIIQGIGGAFLLPTSSAIVFNAFPPNQRGKAMGIYISAGSIFLALGPFIGGLFTQYLTWRLVFWMNIPIAALGYALTLYSVPKMKGIRKNFDFLGFITSSVGITCIIVPLMQTKQWGWVSPATIGMISIGILLLILLYFADRKVEDPYIDFSLFKKRDYLGPLICVCIVQFILMITVFWAMYFQNVFKYSPTGAGLLSLISNAPIIAAAPFAGHLLDKKGPKLPISLGFIFLTGGLFWFLYNIENPNFYVILSAIIPFGIGIPLTLTTSFTTILGSVPHEKRGLASGTTTMLRQFGGTLGLAIVGALFVSVKQKNFGEDLLQNTETVSLNPTIFEGLLSKTTESVDALSSLSPTIQTYVSKAYLHSYISGFKAVNTLGFILAAVGLLLVFVLFRKKASTQK